MVEISKYIDSRKMNVFTEILSQNNGVLTRCYYAFKMQHKVQYYFSDVNDANNFTKDWIRATTPINEVKSSWITSLKRKTIGRIKSFFA